MTTSVLQNPSKIVAEIADIRQVNPNNVTDLAYNRAGRAADAAIAASVPGADLAATPRQP